MRSALPSSTHAPTVMPPTPVQIPPKSPDQLAAEKSEAEAAAALAADGNPDTPGAEPENLTVVETKLRPVEPYSHRKLRLTQARLEKMNRVEILSVGFDRAYWKRGVSLQSKSQLIDTFLAAQDKDDSLHDDPTQVVS